MELVLAGVHLYEFDIGLSDILLGILCLYFLIVLLRRQAHRSASLIFFWLTISAFSGAIFHFFFPLKTETFGWLFTWSIVAISIGIIIFWTLQFLLWKIHIAPVYQWIIVFGYQWLFLFHFFFMSYSYPGIIMFYAPVIIFLWVYWIWKYVFTKKLYYLMLFIWILLSICAGIVQLTHFSLHDTYLTYNTVYHIIQWFGIFWIYYFFLHENYEW